MKHLILLDDQRDQTVLQNVDRNSHQKPVQSAFRNFLERSQLSKYNLIEFPNLEFQLPFQNCWYRENVQGNSMIRYINRTTKQEQTCCF